MHRQGPPALHILLRLPSAQRLDMLQVLHRIAAHLPPLQILRLRRPQGRRPDRQRGQGRRPLRRDRSRPHALPPAGQPSPPSADDLHTVLHAPRLRRLPPTRHNAAHRTAAATNEVELYALTTDDTASRRAAGIAPQHGSDVSTTPRRGGPIILPENTLRGHRIFFVTYGGSLTPEHLYCADYGISIATSSNSDGASTTLLKSKRAHDGTPTFTIGHPDADAHPDADDTMVALPPRQLIQHRHRPAQLRPSLGRPGPKRTRPRHDRHRHRDRRGLRLHHPGRLQPASAHRPRHPDRT